MSDTIELRDHSDPCEHVFPAVWQHKDGLWFCDLEGCPGGKRIVLEKAWALMPSDDGKVDDGDASEVYVGRTVWEEDDLA